ncbi:MAG: outer membrane protein transport protein [Deltaproteobacteria bacterium]|jgi:long-subunit fatty acid transport protein|nr:outer membrane protein transport protein [Deltaproteobacteria bacterium]
MILGWTLLAVSGSGGGFRHLAPGGQGAGGKRARAAAKNGTGLARKPAPAVPARNPALLSALDGYSVPVGMTLIATEGGIAWEQEARRGRTVSASGSFLIPRTFFNRRLNDRWALGWG